MQAQKMVKEERSIGDLFSELMGETSTLIRQEVALAQVEITNKATAAGKNVGYLVVGGAVGYAALLVLLAGVVAILANFVPLWASALIVAAVVGITAYMLISSALTQLRKTDLAPHEAVQSIKEDAKWLKDQVT
jgi:hypothetical protein